MKKHIKTIAGVLAITLVFSGGVAIGRENISVTAPITASAETYGAFRYAIEYGEITIKGFDKSIRDVVIPSEIEGLPVTNIDMAFYGCDGITSVTIPNSVKNIGSSAFSGCTGLTSVTIPDSVTNIGSSAFSSCTGLTSITIPNSVTNIGDYAFADCINITSITIPGSVKNIGDSAFFDCNSITSITISDGVKNIGDSAFYSCRDLTSITIPNSVTYIGDAAFSDCQNITSVTIPESVTYIDASAFRQCSKLESVTILNPDCEIYNLSNTLGDKSVTTIYGYENSTAQAYAEKYGYNFSSIGTAPETTTTTTQTTTTTTYMPTTTTTTNSGTTTADQRGDVNCDGFIDASDASLILEYYAYLSTNGTMSFEEFLKNN